VYLSPLRALAVDVEKNLRAPLVGIAHAAERLGHPVHTPTVGMRTGDTPADDRRKLARTPPDLLITTPESLYLMLTSAARETLVNVEAVIIDEIHAVAATKRGSHLALTLERLATRSQRPPQRIGLSATQRPLEEIAAFLGGFEEHHGRRPRPVTIVDAGSRKTLDIEVVVPVDDMGALGAAPPAAPGAPVEPGAAPARRSIWPAMHPVLLDLVRQHRSTLIFVNARRLAERLATRLNELAAEEQGGGDDDGASRFTAAEARGAPPVGVELVKAHHGSLSRERRLLIEDELKSGRLRGLVATSSLELGIDMGAVDLVIQVESPGSVARGLQRIGRAGHQVGEPSRGKVFPKHRADLLEAAVVTRRMHEGLIESTHYPRNPLDVLAQQVVAACALDEWDVDELFDLVRRAAPYADLSPEVWEAVLDMLAGRYPSEEFAELRPRIVWDRAGRTVRGRPGAQRLAVTSGGTIPDRGLYGVFLPDGTRVGELDEEMVYESRVGETFLLGASTWRIEDITPERVVVTPAPGQPGRMPFWHGDGPGRPVELGRALGEFVREIRARPEAEAVEQLRTRHDLDERAAANLLGFLAEQAGATGAVPDDRTIVVERFRDEIGDWRVCVLSPFGARVHAPWALALRARLAEEWGVDVELIWSDDGIVLRLPEAIDRLPTDQLLIDPDELDEIIVSHLPSTAMFAARFREASARALLLPRRRPDRRTPLWQQRQKAADLLGVAAHHPTFPILLETTRECCHDVFDLPALRSLLRDLRSRTVRVVEVETAQASPMAQSLLFGWIAVYMYEGDAPLAERRAAALALDRDLLRELLGSEELRELLDPVVLADLELELQRLTPQRAARDADQLTDLLRVLGPLTVEELAARAVPVASGEVAGWVARLGEERRVITVGVAGERRVAAAEDAGRLRDALGCALPPGLPAAFTEPVAAPLEDLVVRHARTHGPFVVRDVASRLGTTGDRVRPILDGLVAAGRLVVGEFRPGGVGREWCDPDVLRQLRRRSLAALRAEVEPVEGAALGRFLPVWQGVTTPGRAGGGSGGGRPESLVEVLATLAGAAVPASVLDVDVLAVRLPGYAPADLDALCTSGEVVWVGAGPLGSGDGRVRLVFRDQVETLVPATDAEALAPLLAQPTHRALHDHLAHRGASFWDDLVRAVAAAGADYEEPVVLTALWDLAWAGEVTNDSLAAVRAFVSGAAGSRSATARRAAPRPRPRPGRLTRLGPPSGAGRWSLVGPLRLPFPGRAAATPTEVAHARAAQLLERYGVLTRETALGEGVEGGFAGVYPVLKVMEEQGSVRRGYFVAGLGAAQFAVPGAVDRLRDLRDPSAADVGPLVLAATDPAQPYGAALSWPPAHGRPARSAGALVVLVAGEAAVFVERGGRSLLAFPGATVDPGWAAALAQVVRSGRRRHLEVARIDGAPARESPHADALRAAGFTDGYRGLVLRHR
jgi:ATP-dependent Lhr-like helicase